VAYFNQQICGCDDPYDEPDNDRNDAPENVNIVVVKSDLFEIYRDIQPAITFDLIVCNPPYIKTAEIGVADKYVLREPKIALDGGADGLSFYRRILGDAPRYLTPNGTIMLEIGCDQSAAVTEIAKANGFTNIKTVKDLGNRDRVIIIKNDGKKI
jgi:release factor glutamine methyltransferase